VGVELKLHLGVLDVPYTDASKSTGDVAEILEAKYHVIELFYEELGADHVQEALEHSADIAIKDLFSGAPAASVDLTFEATEELRTAFAIFVDQKELDGVVPGVPTAASLKGVNHRLKHPYAAANPERPSFKDTGLYQSSFRAWVEE
jgi:hypothetical protein